MFPLYFGKIKNLAVHTAKKQTHPVRFFQLFAICNIKYTRTLDTFENSGNVLNYKTIDVKFRGSDFHVPTRRKDQLCVSKHNKTATDSAGRKLF